MTLALKRSITSRNRCAYWQRRQKQVARVNRTYSQSSMSELVPTHVRRPGVDIELKASENVGPNDLKSLKALAEERKLKRYLCVANDV